MNPRNAVDAIIAGLEDMGVQLSGDDSPLPNTWEEIKDQLQHELSPYWPVYLETLRQFATGFVTSLGEDDVTELRNSLKCESVAALEQKLLQLALSRGKRERVQYRPFDFEYFSYRLLDFTVYGQVLERIGTAQCYAKVFSVAAPFGESGTVDCARIEEILTAQQFEHARSRHWSVASAGFTESVVRDPSHRCEHADE